MKESLKFGPEWLRNTVAPAIEPNSTSAGAPATRHPLAEFRYGREEMLALYDKNCKLPDMGTKHKKLFVDKIQCPLALIPVTDEEVEYTRSSWAPRPSLGGIASGGRGRGSSADRGRGRGRGFFSTAGFQRSTSLYDEEGRSLGRGERSWNGTGESGTTEWSGAGAGLTTSPRKEYVRPGGGVESWRRSRTDDENPVNDWRSSGYSSRDKWSSRSWRDEEGGTNPNSEYPPHAISRSYSNPSGSNGIERKPYSAAGGVPPGKKKPWGDHDDSLPEWATEDPSDYGGSFDATGAFHDSEDDDPRKPKRSKSPRMRRPNSAEDGPDDGEKDAAEKKERDSSEEGGTSSSSSVSGSPPGTQEPIQNQLPEKFDATAEDPGASDDSGKETHVEEQRTEMEVRVHRERVHLISDSSVDRMQEVADDMVAQLIMEDEMSVLEAHGPVVMGKASPLLSNLAAAKDALPRPRAAEFWFYQDPNQKVQGPFSAQEMSEWYVAGYFDETLLVRRSCDSRFSALGELTKICGGAVPFVASHLIPPMNVSPELPPPHQLLTVLSNVAPSPTPVTSQIMDSEIQLRYQLQNLQKNYLMQKQHLILQKLAATETWSRLTVDQQNALLNHHMAQVQLPDHLQSISTMTSLSPQQMALLQQDGVPLGNAVAGAVKIPAMMQQPQNHHNVPSNLQSQQHAKNFLQQQQQQQQLRRQMAPVTANSTPNAGATNPLSQMMQQMSLSHLLAPQNPTSPVVSQQVLTAAQAQQSSGHPKTSQPSPMHETDPIQSLIMQLKIQNGNQMPGIPHPQPKHNQMGDSLLANMWGGSNQGTSLQQLLQGGGNQFVGQQPNRGLVMMDDGIEALRRQQQQQMEQQQQQQQQQQQEPQMGGGWKQPNPLLSMWDMPQNNAGGNMGAMGQNFDKTDHIADDSMRSQQEELMNEHVNEVDTRAESKVEHEMKQHKQEHPPKNERKKRDEEPQPKNMKKKENDTKKGGQNKKETDEKRREVEKQQQRSKEQAKKRQIEEEKARKQTEESKRKIAEEKRRLDEMNEQQRKSKILEAQRRETVKIQEIQMQQQQQHSRQPTTMAPWSTAGVPTGPSLVEIEKLERQQRAEQMRQEHAIREQQEHQQMLQLQQQKENILKWNASVKPQAVKSLAEIQAEEQSKQSAVEREMAERQAAKQREKKELDTITGASFWAQSMQTGSAWNTAKIWGPHTGGNGTNPTSNSTSGGGFWEEPTGKVASGGGSGGSTQKGNSSKTLAKSQTMGSITTNKTSAEKQQLQSKATNKSTSNVSAGTSSGSAQKRGPNKDKVKDDVSNEFTNWCSKTLTNLKANVDVPTFVTFLQDIESPFEVKDYVRMYLGETKECSEFSKQYLERRSKLRSHQRAQNAHIDDMCSPAPALTPFNDFQEVKNKSKKIKKNKMTKVDNRILGFSVTAAPEHWNLEKNLDNSS